MLIDWFTVGAQVLNFCILVWLMKRFLYHPILHAIDEREKLIAAQLSDAETQKAEARKQRDEFQHKNELFDKERAELLNQAVMAAKTERQRLLDEARTAAETLQTKRLDILKSDAQHLNQAIYRQTQQEVFNIVRKALTDLASTCLEERLSDVFIRRLRDLDDSVKAGIAQKLKTQTAIVRSAFELPAEHCAAIQNALNETFAAEIQLQFETAPDIISGIELSVNGWKLAWSISDYITTLEKSVDELIKPNAKAVK